jgi:hypothetical protein
VSVQSTMTESALRLLVDQRGKRSGRVGAVVGPRWTRLRDECVQLVHEPGRDCRCRLQASFWERL